MQDVRAQIEPLQALLSSLQSEKRGLEMQLSSLHRQPVTSAPAPGKRAAQSGIIDYQTSSFPWSASLVPLAKSTFNIPSFRLCQEGVINAAIDGRDIVCVMPTGGGKSLTYQLPAVQGNTGFTVVISPLLALIWDQVRGLGEIGVEAAVSLW
jgi:ATP-dependent DNA helicase Q1